MYILKILLHEICVLNYLVTSYLAKVVPISVPLFMHSEVKRIMKSKSNFHKVRTTSSLSQSSEGPLIAFFIILKLSKTLGIKSTYEMIEVDLKCFGHQNRNFLSLFKNLSLHKWLI